MAHDDIATEAESIGWIFDDEDFSPVVQLQGRPPATTRKARYVHLCAGCGKPIPVNRIYVDVSTRRKRTRYHVDCFVEEVP